MVDRVARPLDVVFRRTLRGADARDYDAFLDSARGAHYAQHRAWAPVAVAGKRRAARFFLARSEGRVVGAALVQRPRLVGPVLAPVAIVDRGPVCDDPADLDAVLAALLRATRMRGVARLTVMPYWAGDDVATVHATLARARFTDVQAFDGAHAVTFRVDVEGKSDEAILAGSERSGLRRKLRDAERAGVTVRRAEPAEIDVLARLDAALNTAQGRSTRAVWFDAAAAYLRGDPTRGAVLVSEHEGQPISAVLVLRFARTAVYCAGASIVDARPFSKMAHSLFGAARWARDAGCTTFDLGGVPMEGDTDPKRVAIAQFKREFAKTPVLLVHEHARWL